MGGLLGLIDAWLKRRREAKHEAEWERMAEARERKLRTLDLSGHGVHQAPMGMWSADGVEKLFRHPEDALLAMGWCAIFSIDGTIFIEPWTAQMVYPCGLRPGPECADRLGCDFWCKGARDEKVAWDCT